MSVRKSAVYEHFAEEENHFKCTVDMDGKACDVIVAKNKSDGSSSGNLKRHLKRAHPKHHESVQQKDETNKKPALEKGQTTMNRFLPTSGKTTTVTVKKSDLENGILKMVAYDGSPLTFFSNQGFKTIAGAAAEKLGVSLGPNQVRELVIKRAKFEMENLCQELKGKFYSLKFDGATRLRTHFLGITIQYYGIDALKVKTLALIDTKAYHDSQHLKGKFVY